VNELEGMLAEATGKRPEPSEIAPLRRGAGNDPAQG
jgi:hypothetical protein